MVSQFLWKLTQHHADFSRHHQALTMKRFYIHPPGVPTTSTSPQTLPNCHSSPAVAPAGKHRESPTRGLRRILGHQLSPRRCCSALFAPVSSFVQWSVVANEAYSVSLNVRMVPGRFFCSRWKVRHCLPVVVLDKFRSKLQDFSDVRRRHITAPLPCASFACSVTRSTTNGDEQNFMVWTPYANDLRLEMAHLSQCGTSVLMKVKLRTIDNKRADKHITLTAHIWIEWLVPDTVSHNEGICPPLRSLSSICGTGTSTICSSRSGFQVRTAYTKSSN